jgi:hypothetical protein
MAERKGLRQWQESIFFLQAPDRDAAFQRALQLGRRGQESERKKTGWVDKRLAEVVELGDPVDCHEIELGAKPADRAIPFEHVFDPERSVPPPVS